MLHSFDGMDKLDEGMEWTEGMGCTAMDVYY